MAQENNVYILEALIVTAQKRPQEAQDIGVSVTAFDGEFIKELDMDKPKDIAAFTPGLSTANATSGGTPIFAIRGIGLDDYNINNTSGVGVYVDEVYAGNPVLLTGQLFDIERVEVLKGPQGTLYGKNTTGGAINYVSRRPTEEFEGSMTAGYGRWDTLDLTGYINGPVADKLNGRLAYSYVNQDEGWQEDINTGKKFGALDALALRGMLAYEVSDKLSTLLSLRYSKDESLPDSPQGIDPFGAGLGGFATLPDDPTAVDADGSLEMGRDEEGYGGTFHLTAEFAGLTFDSISAWDSYDRFVADNYNGFSTRSYDFIQDNELEQWWQEFRLTSNGNGMFSWVAGLTYSYDEIKVNDFADSTDSAFFTAESLYEQDTESFGAYLHTETSLTDDLTLTVGLRYSLDDSEFVGQSFADFGDGAFPAATLDQDESEDNVDYRVGLDYDITENLLLFANVATGYKTGVFYGSPVTDQRVWAYTDPEEVFSYELGFKATLLDGAMRLNGSAFHYDYDDRQSLILACQDSGERCGPEGPSFNDITDIFTVGLDNIDESEIEGFELELEWLVMVGLNVRAGVGYLESETKTLKTDLRGIPLQFDLLPGEKLSQAPEWSYNLVTSYEADVSNNFYGRVQFAYSHIDEQVAALSDANAVYGSIETLDMRLAVGRHDTTWEVALWGKNLTDENGSTYSFTNFLGGPTVYRQRPASYGVELTYSFF